MQPHTVRKSQKLSEQKPSVPDSPFISTLEDESFAARTADRPQAVKAVKIDKAAKSTKKREVLPDCPDCVASAASTALIAVASVATGALFVGLGAIPKDANGLFFVGAVSGVAALLVWSGRKHG